MSKPYPGHPIRSVRIPDPLWTKAKAKAKAEGFTISDFIREALELYLEESENDPDL